MSNTSIFANQHPCPVCNQPILNQGPNHDPLGCDGPCQTWFHRQCVGLSRIQYGNVIEHDEEWRCETCIKDSVSIHQRIERQPTPQPTPQPENSTIQGQADPYPQYTKAINANSTSNGAT